MEEYEESGGWFQHGFRTFVCVALSALLALQAYSHVAAAGALLDADFSDLKYVVLQLTRSLSEVNRKHEKLKSDMERLSETLPGAAPSAGRARDALQPLRGVAPAPHDLHDYDRQIVDYALETAGAKVIDTGDTEDYVVHESPVGWALHALAALLCRECVGARAAIRPGALPGQCWPFRGSRGEVTILLLATIRVTAISLEHIPPHITPLKDIASAPRLFQLEGLQYRGDPYPHNYGSFEYDKEGKPIQYFEVLNPTTRGYNVVRVKIMSNWGHPEFTCVYRIRIHGELVPGQVPRNSVTDDSDMKIEIEN